MTDVQIFGLFVLPVIVAALGWIGAWLARRYA
jgi:hypothetical protein